MGLAQAKTRRKINKDPNNTKWSKDTDSFGQKILRSQGWEPGQYLGAKDAAHAVHHTAANASFIRVALKDDMLGLGFKQARDDRVTGMDAFSDLLGRLNGKSTELIDKDRQARAQLKSTLYCDTKFGPMRFVRGGWLVGDQVREEPDAEPKDEDKDDVKMEDIPSVADKKSKKRKVEESSDEDSSSSEDEKARKKRRKQEKKAAKKVKAESADSDDASATDKKDKKRKSKKEDVSEDTQDESENKSKKKRKEKETDAEKAARKEEKRQRKEEKRAKKEEKRAKKEASRESSSTPATGTSTPAASGTSTPVLRGHHAVRSRWIAQKKLATMDDKALNQVRHRSPGYWDEFLTLLTRSRFL
ncbi:g-patch domain-containing protein [Colletotrichum musicola]|uniref:PinX1-related protein 1 n=1 Tax=Colletotrichum musicola TaxID=2175873 RepID=A0A8H6NDK5_9PEZI|nr:g-patch domain-containing protein [Colletotrichum musicola]